MRSRPLPLALISLLRCRLVDSWGYCNDKDVSCAKWANNGECKGENAELVKKLCPLSCKTCSLLCRDEEEECEGWAKGGQCEINRDFMSKTCPTSCGTCKPVCYDKDEMCGQWARSGECKKNPSMILPTCPVSCGVCTSMCFDKITECPQWAAHGDCNSNPGFMLKSCPVSCSVCDEKEHGSKKCADRDRHQCLALGEQECVRNPSTVMRLCPDLCGLCTLACEDRQTDCHGWAAAKEGLGCKLDKDYMLDNCPHSCNICPKIPEYAPRIKKAEL